MLGRLSLPKSYKETRKYLNSPLIYREAPYSVYGIIHLLMNISQIPSPKITMTYFSQRLCVYTALISKFHIILHTVYIQFSRLINVSISAVKLTEELKKIPT